MRLRRQLAQRRFGMLKRLALCAERRIAQPGSRCTPRFAGRAGIPPAIARASSCVPSPATIPSSGSTALVAPGGLCLFHARPVVTTHGHQLAGRRGCWLRHCLGRIGGLRSGLSLWRRAIQGGSVGRLFPSKGFTPHRLLKRRLRCTDLLGIAAGAGGIERTSSIQHALVVCVQRGHGAFPLGALALERSVDRLAERLERIETTLEKTLLRSDEQLAYYVAQAREVVDLSLLAQKQVFDELQALSATRDAGESATA